MLKKFLLHPTSSAIIQLFRYGLVVAIAFPIDFGLLYVFTEFLHLHYLVSTILAFTISMLVNFVISVLWVFRLRADRPLWKEVVAFFIIGFVGLGLTAAIVWFSTSVLGIYYLVSKLIAVCLVFFWSFGARRLMFMKHTGEYIDIVKDFFKKHTFLTSPAFIMFIVSLILFAVNIILVYKLRPFTSDDVFWQAILLHWQPFDGSTVTLGNSSIYVDKVPMYQFLSLFFEPGRKILFIQAAVPAVIGFAGFYWASVYLLRKARAKITYASLLPFAWIASLGYSFASLYLNPNWRGFQVGFSFIIFALAAALWSGDIKLKSIWSKIILLLLAAYTGLQLHSDPYLLYFTLAPLAVFSLIMFLSLRRIGRRSLLITVGSIIATYIFSKIFAAISLAAGVRSAVEYPMQFIPFDKLADSLGGTVHSLITIFSADPFGLKITDEVISPLLNLVILIAIVFATYRLVVTVRKSKIATLPVGTLWLVFFAFVMAFVAAVYIFSTMGQGILTYRYLLLLALLCIPILSYLITTTKRRPLIYAIAGFFVIAIFANSLLTVTNRQERDFTADSINNPLNIENTKAIDVLKDTGYTKGYANYWDASISTYLSKGDIAFLPSLCPNERVHLWHWLINDNAFNVKADKTFYIYNRNASLAPCKIDDINKQLGTPTKILESGQWKIFLYDYDITSRLPEFIVKY